jgi:hypothetical protein
VRSPLHLRMCKLRPATISSVENRVAGLDGCSQLNSFKAFTRRFRFYLFADGMGRAFSNATRRGVVENARAGQFSECLSVCQCHVLVGRWWHFHSLVEMAVRRNWWGVSSSDGEENSNHLLQRPPKAPQFTGRTKRFLGNHNCCIYGFLAACRYSRTCSEHAVVSIQLIQSFSICVTVETSS